MGKGKKTKFKPLTKENVELITTKKLQEDENNKADGSSSSRPKSRKPSSNKCGNSSSSSTNKRDNTAAIKTREDINQAESQTSSSKIEQSLKHDVDKVKSSQQLKVQNFEETSEKVEAVGNKDLELNSPKSAQDTPRRVSKDTSHTYNETIVNTSELKVELSASVPTNIEPQPDNVSWICEHNSSPQMGHPLSPLNPQAVEFKPGGRSENPDHTRSADMYPAPLMDLVKTETPAMRHTPPGNSRANKIYGAPNGTDPFQLASIKKELGNISCEKPISYKEAVADPKNSSGLRKDNKPHFPAGRQQIKPPVQSAQGATSSSQLQVTSAINSEESLTMDSEYEDWDANVNAFDPANIEVSQKVKDDKQNKHIDGDDSAWENVASANKPFTSQKDNKFQRNARGTYDERESSQRQDKFYSNSSGRANTRRSYDPPERRRDPRIERELNKSLDSARASGNSASSSDRGEQRYKPTRITTFDTGHDITREKTDQEFDQWESVGRKIKDFHVVQEIEGDLFGQPKDYSLAHCVAEDLRMGSGIAVDFKREFKNLPDLLDQRAKQGGLATLHDEPNNRFVYYLVTKRESTGKPTYHTLWKSLVKMRDHVKENEVKKLAIPRLGCGLDRLEWIRVKSMIEHLFKDVDVEIKVCNFQQEEDVLKKPPTTCKVVVEDYAITTIAAQTLILYFTTEQGDVDEAMQELSKKFNFLLAFKNHKPKRSGDIVYADCKTHGLCGCIVRKSVRDEISFKSLFKCIQEINKMNRKFKDDAFVYVAFQQVRENDFLLQESINSKIITVLINGLINVDVYMCKGYFELNTD